MLEESALRTVLKPPGANSFNKRKQPCHPCVSPCGTRVKYQPTLSASSLSSVLRHLSSELCLQPQTQWSSALTRHPWCLMPYAHRLFNQNRPERMKVNKLRTSLTYNNFSNKRVKRRLDPLFISIRSALCAMLFASIGSQLSQQRPGSVLHIILPAPLNEPLYLTGVNPVKKIVE